MRLEGVSFFGVYALDFEVEAEGVAGTGGEGDGFGAAGFDVDEEGGAAGEHEESHGFALGECLAADEEHASEEIAHGGDFDLFPFRGLVARGSPFAQGAEVSALAFDEGDERAGGVVFHEVGAEGVEGAAVGASVEVGVELVEPPHPTRRSAAGGETRGGGIAGEGRMGAGGVDFGPSDAEFGLEGRGFGEGAGGGGGEGVLPGVEGWEEGEAEKNQQRWK